MFFLVPDRHLKFLSKQTILTANSLAELPLEAQPQGYLCRSAWTSTGHDAKVCRSESETRYVEIGVVQQIIKLTTHVEFHTFGDLKRLFHRCIGCHERRATQT